MQVFRKTYTAPCTLRSFGGLGPGLSESSRDVILQLAVLVERSISIKWSFVEIQQDERYDLTSLEHAVPVIGGLLPD